MGWYIRVCADMLQNTSQVVMTVYTRLVGRKEHKLKNHLGNMRVVIRDLTLLSWDRDSGIKTRELVHGQDTQADIGMTTYQFRHSLHFLRAIGIMAQLIVLGCNPEEFTLGPPAPGWTEFAYINDSSLPDASTDVAFDVHDNVWSASSNGIWMFDGERWLKVDSTINKPLKIATDLHDKVWVLTEHDGVFVFDGKDWRHYTTENTDRNLPATGLTSIAADLDGNIWIGSIKGVTRFDGVNWVLYDDTSLGGPLSRYVLDIATDKKGHVWLANEYGVSEFDGTNWLHFSHENVAGEFPDQGIVSIAVDATGRPWIGTVTGDISTFDGNEWSTYWHVGTPTIGEHITSLAVDSLGNIWATTYGEGGKGVAARYDGTSWKYYDISNSGGTLPGPVYDVGIAPDNAKWFTTSMGITRYAGQ